MNLLKKFSLVYSLQISAVFILFFYPGCSSLIKQKEIKGDKTVTIIEKKTGRGTNTNTIIKAAGTLNFLMYNEPGETNYSLISGSGK